MHFHRNESSTVDKYILDNGLTVVLQEIPTAVSASVGLCVKTGSQDEMPECYGYAHFVEHMLFKGTKRFSAKELSRQIDRVGGQHNAATNREYTIYYISLIAEHIDLALDILSDTFYNSLFDTEDIEKEKEVILEEIKMYEDSADEHIHDVFMEAMYGGNSLGHYILGNAQSIKSASKESLYNFYSQYYYPENSVLVIVGKIDYDAVKNIILKYFITKKNLVKPIERLQKDNSRLFRKHIDRDLEQIHFCLGFNGISRSDPDRWSLYILSTILGGSSSSRLFQSIRENEGLCYSIYSFHSSYSDTGIFGIYCGTSPDKFDKAFNSTLEECRKIVKDGVSEEEFQDAKTFLKGNLALSLESNDVRMSQIARDELYYGRYFNFEEIINYIDCIQMKNLNDIIQRVFKERAALVTIGKIPKDKQQEIFVI